ncbi:hypothetical protein ACELLULO517_06445 [Acidisoma cellulosilytica]|uniref:Alpha/beta hydrolase n=1 Tax=Acidisoma cellulosilyticum TaxID=2802395 RepID=A0A963YZM6_9PROT|nr:hypothetical protein [Acidisoma cellulosilyticum]MCB8879866.1 hypothetical protein [Acidisoma cellulosilyticum]
MERTEILHKNRSLEVHFRRGNSPFCLITFNPLETRSNGRFYWGRAIAEKWDYTCLGFVTHGNNWFPELDMEEAVQAVGPYLSGENILYGCSMGGYAAVRYSKLLNAKMVIAFSPLLSIDPQDVPDDRRWHRLHRPQLHPNMRVRERHVQGDLLVFYDPFHHYDAPHGNEISRYAKGVALPLPFTGHETLVVAAQFPGFSGIIERCVHNRESLPGYMKEGRLRSPMFYFLAAARMADRGKYRWARRLLDKADELKGINWPAHDALRLKIYALCGLSKEASVFLPMISFPETKDDVAWNVWADAADIFSKNGFIEISDKLYERLLEVSSLLLYERYIACLALRKDYCRIASATAAATAAFPEDVRMPIKAGNAFLESNQDACAILMYEMAIARQPSLTWPHHALVRIYKARNDLGMIRQVLRRTLDLEISDETTISYRDRFGVA